MKYQNKAPEARFFKNSWGHKNSPNVKNLGRIIQEVKFDYKKYYLRIALFVKLRAGTTLEFFGRPKSVTTRQPFPKAKNWWASLFYFERKQKILRKVLSSKRVSKIVSFNLGLYEDEKPSKRFCGNRNELHIFSLYLAWELRKINTLLFSKCLWLLILWLGVEF